MLRLLLKITAILTGLAIITYLLKRNLKVWELEVIEPQRSSPAAKVAPAQKPKPQKPKQKKNTSHDDLKQIRGIGPALEEQLNDLGIHTFQQIASLTPQDIERIETQMNGFSSRIERDHWIEQAKALSK